MPAENVGNIGSPDPSDKVAKTPFPSHSKVISSFEVEEDEDVELEPIAMEDTHELACNWTVGSSGEKDLHSEMPYLDT